MARRVSRGDVWLYRFAAPDKRRPVVVLSRQDAIDALSTVTIAPITSTIRGLRSEVVLGTAHGMKSVCAINLDHVQTVRQASLVRWVTTLPPAVLTNVCRALGVAVGCT